MYTLGRAAAYRMVPRRPSVYFGTVGMTIDRDPAASTVGLRHATGLLRARRVTDEARRMRISQSRADQHWQAIKDGLGQEQCQ